MNIYFFKLDNAYEKQEETKKSMNEELKNYWVQEYYWHFELKAK